MPVGKSHEKFPSFLEFLPHLLYLLMASKRKAVQKGEKCSKYNVVLFIRKQRLPTVSAILNIG